MVIPPQGFRHAATLLIDKSARSIPADASSNAVADALARLAGDLVALADDMRAAPAYADWLCAEYTRTVARLPHSFDRAAAVQTGSVILNGVKTRREAIESRDLFLVYLPEDRLSIAAPLAVELAKRRVSVAFSEYEVATQDQLTAALQHGLEHHAAGIVLRTAAFERARWTLLLPESERLWIVHQTDLPAQIATLAERAHRLIGNHRAD
jgi:hypothetical protein